VDDPKNMLNLNPFHKIKKGDQTKKERKHTDKKRIRDIERLLARPNLPDELVKKKKDELHQLKKSVKSKKEAEKFELRYKKIKFIEKRKVIRQIERLEKEVKKASEGEAQDKLKKEKEQWSNRLTYIDNYPSN